MTRLWLYAVVLAVLLLVGIVGGAGWYLFRPEKAFIDDVVDEPFPGKVSPGSAAGPGSANGPEHR